MEVGRKLLCSSCSAFSKTQVPPKLRRVLSCESPAVFLHFPLEKKGPWGPFYQLGQVLPKGRHVLQILLKALSCSHCFLKILQCHYMDMAINCSVIIITIEKHFFQQHLQSNVIKLIDNQTSITIAFVHILNRLKI